MNLIFARKIEQKLKKNLILKIQLMGKKLSFATVCVSLKNRFLSTLFFATTKDDNEQFSGFMFATW